MFEETKSSNDLRQKALSLLVPAFLDNPRMHSLLGGKSFGFSKKLRILLSYPVTICERLDGIYISKNGKTLVLYYRKADFNHSLIDYFNYVRIPLCCVPKKQLISNFHQEQRISNFRDAPQDYLYTWFLCQERAYKKIDGLIDVYEHISSKAKKLSIPILVETTERKVLKLYKRVGFDVYNQWHNHQTDMSIWFARKDFV